MYLFDCQNLCITMCCMFFYIFHSFFCYNMNLYFGPAALHYIINNILSYLINILLKIPILGLNCNYMHIKMTLLWLGRFHLLMSTFLLCIMQRSWETFNFCWSEKYLALLIVSCPILLLDWLIVIQPWLKDRSESTQVQNSSNNIYQKEPIQCRDFLFLLFFLFFCMLKLFSNRGALFLCSAPLLLDSCICFRFCTEDCLEAPSLLGPLCN